MQKGWVLIESIVEAYSSTSQQCTINLLMVIGTWDEIVEGRYILA
jgi:hypothetical protein